MPSKLPSSRMDSCVSRMPLKLVSGPRIVYMPLMSFLFLAIY
ncbi:hypothetical protein HP1_126 [Candidatus Termititenax spirochaetophilus]|uniref:Uncharacterized protein n=1 Tax=Candidatus Termititenax spirochaetophilus TaxID=2218522 RepID=A0A388T8G5_9BACT|nr:hypothetical protein HP1_126 [Candidatus Termititenax spirochaetophilus]